MEILFLVFAVVFLSIACARINERRYAATRQLQELEQKMDLILNHAGIQLPPPAASPVVLSWLQAGMKIQAIKAYREETGVSLRDAKEAVEDLEKKLAAGQRVIHSPLGQLGDDPDQQNITQIKRGLG